MNALWRNRDFNLLWTSQTLSDLGTAVSGLALPLLVLATTGSAVRAGVVGTVGQLAGLACRLPAGVLVDRVDRRRTMLACDGVRLAAFAALAALVATGRVTLAAIVVVAAVDAVGGALFSTAERSALRMIVPAAQLPAAVARNEARGYATSLAGPPLGGLLFGLAHAVPFLANAVSYLASLTGVALIRSPTQQQRDDPPGGYGAAIAEGVRFVVGHPFLRMVVLVAVPLNFAINGVIFTIVVSLQRQGTPAAVIGLAETIVGVGGLLGAVAAPALQARLRLPTLVRAICWAAAVLLGTTALLTTSVAAAAPVALVVLLAPAVNAALFGYQAAITPDRLQGRVVSVIFLVATSAAALAPLLSGLLVEAWGGPAAIAPFALAVAGSAVMATVGRGLHRGGQGHRTDREFERERTFHAPPPALTVSETEGKSGVAQVMLERSHWAGGPDRP